MTSAISVMCMHCRVALEAAAASPAAADLAARCLTAQPFSQNADKPNDNVDGSAGSESQLARSHVASLVCIVGMSAQACWLAVSEEEKPRPAHYQALLDTFAFDTLFCHDKPAGLRHVPHPSKCTPAAACCITIHLAMQCVLGSLEASVHTWSHLQVCRCLFGMTSWSPAFYSILKEDYCFNHILVLSRLLCLLSSITAWHGCDISMRDLH